MNRPTLMLLVGIPGSGKSTYAHKYIKEHPDAICLSSDKIREELWGNEATQGDNNEVFHLMQCRAVEALNNGQSVIYDATNITRKDRAYIISQCPKFVKIKCYIIWAPIETCIERDASRARTVGKDVIDRMLKRFQAPYYDEGIDEIKIIVPDDWNEEVCDEYKEKLWESLDIPHDNPHHTLNVQNHCIEAVQYVLNRWVNNDDLIASTCWHDVGKPYVKAFVDSKGNPCDTAHYYSHNNFGSWLVYGVSTDVDPFIAWLVCNHMEPFFNSKYYQKLPTYLKDMVDKLHEADKAAH